MQIGKKILYVIGGFLALSAVLAIALPSILKSRGFHPDDPDGTKFDLKGKKALIVSTSHNVLNKPGETTGPPTGVFASEMTIPYYEFLDANREHFQFVPLKFKFYDVVKQCIPSFSEEDTP